MAVESSVSREFEVPSGETPVTRCPYCDRPFGDETFATFHVGLEHAEECTDAEREAYEEARRIEDHDLFTFHVKASVTVLVTYFTFTFMYALAWT